MPNNHKSKGTKTFFTNVDVTVINRDSPFFRSEGIIIGEKDKLGNYLVQLKDGDKTDTEAIFCDDLELTEDAAEILAAETRTYVIKGAKLKDGVCNYSYEIISGTGMGDKCNIKGSGIYKDTLVHAFCKLRVHLACIDDVFKHNGLEITDIDMMHGEELTHLFDVTGFQMDGEEGDEKVILIGTKYLNTGGPMEIKTPKIPIDGLSSYKWYNELATAIETAREEVALYKEGNYEIAEPEEPKGKGKGKQLRLDEQEGDDDDFESGKI